METPGRYRRRMLKGALATVFLMAAAANATDGVAGSGPHPGGTVASLLYLGAWLGYGTLIGRLRSDSGLRHLTLAWAFTVVAAVIAASVGPPQIAACSASGWPGCALAALWLGPTLPLYGLLAVSAVSIHPPGLALVVIGCGLAVVTAALLARGRRAAINPRQPTADVGRSGLSRG